MFYKRKQEHTEFDKQILAQFLEELHTQITICYQADEIKIRAYLIGIQALKDDSFEVIEDSDTNMSVLYIPGIPSELMEAWFYTKEVCG